MPETCPWCGANSVDVTTYQGGADQRRRFLCTGPECHEWREGDGPEPDSEPLIILATH